MHRKKVVLLIAHEGYQQVEYGIPREILASENIDVITASDQSGTATAKDSSTTVVDLTIEQLNAMQIDGLFIIGGPGALDCLDTPAVHSLLQQLMALKKPYGAICISTRILAHAEVLAGKKATGWDEDDELTKIFASHDVIYEKHPVVIDGNVITATGPDAAQAFAQAILKVVAP